MPSLHLGRVRFDQTIVNADHTLDYVLISNASISTKECVDILSGHSEIGPDTYVI